jgi:putative dimethyl sulfoxide reductase chaperone
MHKADSPKNLARIRRDFYGLLALAYVQIPTLDNLELNWEPAAELLTFSLQDARDALGQVKQGLDLIGAYAVKLQKNEKTLTDLARDWTRLFRGVEKGNLLPPYESLYRTGKLQGKPVQEVHRLFAGMGIRVPEEWHQPPDYIGVELDFMRFLCSREIESLEGRNAISTADAIAAERSFLENHLTAWVPNFCERMIAQARESYYGGIGSLTLGLLEYDRRLRAKSSPATD